MAKKKSNRRSTPVGSRRKSASRSTPASRAKTGKKSKRRSMATMKTGDLLAYTCTSGRVIYLRVIHFTQHRPRDASAIVDICQWTSPRPPTVSEAIAAPWATGTPESGFNRYLCFLLREMRPVPMDRVAFVARGVDFGKVNQQHAAPTLMCNFRVLDAQLQECLGIS